MTDITSLLLDVFILYAAARLGGEVFERLKQPALVGELVAGAIIGPHALGLVRNSADLTYELLAQLGVVILLFFVGLETPVDALLRVGRRAFLVALGGAIATSALLAGFLLFTRHETVETLFVAAVLVPTGIGMSARVLRDLGVLESTEARVILGAAVIDDVFGLFILSIVSGIATTGQVDALQAGLIALQAAGFTLFVAMIGVGAVRRFDLHLERLHLENPSLSVALLVMLGLAAAAGLVGLAAIVGAFIAGMVFAEATQQRELRDQALPIYQFLAPFFFVITGTHIDLAFFANLDLLGFTLAITVLAMLGKLLGCGLSGAGLGRRSMAVLGTGMMPRGEVMLIGANAGLRLGAFSPEMFNAIVAVSVLTTVAAPALLHRIYAGRGPRATDSC